MKICLYDKTGSPKWCELVNISYFPTAIYFEGEFYLQLVDGYYSICDCHVITPVTPAVDVEVVP